MNDKITEYNNLIPEAAVGALLTIDGGDKGDRGKNTDGQMNNSGFESLDSFLVK